MPPSPVSTKGRSSPFHPCPTRLNGTGSRQRAARCPAGYRVLSRPADTTSGIPNQPEHDTWLRTAMIAVGRIPIDANSLEITMVTTIKVNGVDRTVDVDNDTPLLWVLRDVLGMTGTKFGCGMALCGACTVHIDGVATRSCITPVDSIGTSEITTIDAIGATATRANSQKAWLDREVVQCGYCPSGQIMSASALLASN